MCWSLERWGEIEAIARMRRESDRAVAELLADATAPRETGIEPVSREDRVPALAARATPGTGA